ncbi:hypothetical protein D3C71_1566450 [compost metagenome]
MSLNTGSRSYSVRPICTCCAPCPGNRNATLGDRDSTRPLAWCNGSRPCSARTAPAWSCASTAVRWSNRRRPAFKVCAAAVSEICSGAWRWPARRSAMVCTAAALRAESRSRCGRWAAAACTAGRCGASSTTTCALVPPMPKELTPARRGCAPMGHARASVLTKNGLAPKSICGLGVSKFRLGGRVACLSAITVLMSPVTPAAASRWPMLVLTEPMAQ